eukprot:Sspe_Gene.95948::Locus_68303_Transcript_1_1_Confidence_1.000_Length_1603::g.95948::m.95948
MLRWFALFLVASAEGLVVPLNLRECEGSTCQATGVTGDCLPLHCRGAEHARCTLIDEGWNYSSGARCALFNTSTCNGESEVVTVPYRTCTRGMELHWPQWLPVRYALYKCGEAQCNITYASTTQCNPIPPCMGEQGYLMCYLIDNKKLSGGVNCAIYRSSLCVGAPERYFSLQLHQCNANLSLLLDEPPTPATPTPRVEEVYTAVTCGGSPHCRIDARTTMCIGVCGMQWDCLATNDSNVLRCTTYRDTHDIYCTDPVETFTLTPDTCTALKLHNFSFTILPQPPPPTPPTPAPPLPVIPYDISSCDGVPCSVEGKTTQCVPLPCGGYTRCDVFQGYPPDQVLSCQIFSTPTCTEGSQRLTLILRTSTCTPYRSNSLRLGIPPPPPPSSHLWLYIVLPVAAVAVLAVAAAVLYRRRRAHLKAYCTV